MLRISSRPVAAATRALRHRAIAVAAQRTAAAARRTLLTTANANRSETTTHGERAARTGGTSVKWRNVKLTIAVVVRSSPLCVSVQLAPARPVRPGGPAAATWLRLLSVHTSMRGRRNACTRCTAHTARSLSFRPCFCCADVSPLCLCSVLLRVRHPACLSSVPEHIVLTMPALSPTMEKGNIASWLVKVGDKIKSGDVMAEVRR